ncbi:hypothetical protein PEAC54167_06735 [Pediococcus acidilactici]|uniref:hypothetical protein n=2 Tax=Lactobacillaceae TaxID=33958 RepID=UPI000E5C6D70|nr:hypothetical protein [Pediococcus acidilactici]KAF0516379.1 hypothetical protein GBP29_06800 [Pediococcus acidilactici]MCT3036145.1 hypothetical protein [Pediococcus acidilactici]RJF53965.1 hypothetical protein DSN65_00015 [Pediococcus acidilactici]
MDMLNLDNNDSKLKVGQFSIDKNILQIADFNLHIQNIAYFYTGKILVTYPIGLYILMGILGLALLALMPLLGIVVLIALGIMIYMKYREKLNSSSYISIVMNNNYTYRILVQDKDFMKKVVETIQQSINGKSEKYIVNIENQQINNGNMGGGMSINDNSNHINIDFKQLNEEIKQAKAEYTEDSIEFKMLSQMEEAANTENTSKLRKILQSVKELAPDFIKDTFSQVVAGMLINLM